MVYGHRREQSRDRQKAVSACTATCPDQNGNMTNDGYRSFAYDDENELIGVWVSNAWSNSFAYDGKMRRRIVRDYSWNGGTSAWQETNEIHFIYDGNLVVEERSAANVSLVSYTRGNDLSGSLQSGDGIGGLLARTIFGQEISGAPASAFYHADGNGNITALVYPNQQLAAKYLYDSFGNMLALSGPLMNFNEYRFSSKEWDDNSGLYYYGYRFYDPDSQRWSNRDPLGEAGFVNAVLAKRGARVVPFTQFAEWLLGPNLYAFVSDDPLSRVDYAGLDTPFWPSPLLPGNCDPVSLASCEAACALEGLIVESCNQKETWKFRGIEGNQLVWDVWTHVDCQCTDSRWPALPPACTDRNGPPDLPPHIFN